MVVVGSGFFIWVIVVVRIGFGIGIIGVGIVGVGVIFIIFNIWFDVRGVGICLFMKRGNGFWSVS